MSDFSDDLREGTWDGGPPEFWDARPTFRPLGFQVELGGHGPLLVWAQDRDGAVAAYFAARGITASAHRPAVEEYPYPLPEE